MDETNENRQLGACENLLRSNVEKANETSEQAVRERGPYSARLPSNEQRDHLMVQIAKLYYELDQTQSEIAAEIGLTRWQVGKLLTEAKQAGIVRIEITPRAGRKAALELELQCRFKLKSAVIVPVGEGADPDLIIANLAQAGAMHLANLQPKPALMGVSWGRMMAALARALPQDWCPGLHVVLLNGATALTTPTQHHDSVVEQFARSAPGQATLLPVPAIMGSKMTRDALECDPIIRRILDLGQSSPVVCFGLGGLNSQSVLLDSGFINADDVVRLQGLGAVGDIMGRFVNHHGEIVDGDLDARTIGMRLESLATKERVIGFAGGEEKHEIAAACLRAGYVTDFVTDEVTAQHILNETAANMKMEPNS